MQRTRSERFAEGVRSGRPLREVLAEDGRQHRLHHDAVVSAAIEMLAAHGAIDMKRLASEAGMSRASLYRYYPERRELIGEIAGLAVDELVVLTSAAESAAERVRIVGHYMLTHRAQAIAAVEMAEQASTDALDTVAELLVGDSMHAPWLIGIASMCATPRMTEADVARVQRHIEGLAALVEA